MSLEARSGCEALQPGAGWRATARLLPIAAVTVMLASFISGCSRKPDTLECPAPESGKQVGELGETAAQLAVTGEELGNGSENAIGSAIASLRSRRPGARSDAIVNDLITAYCPSINRRSALDLAAKHKVMASFSLQVRRIVDAS